MASSSRQSVAIELGTRMLRTALGPAIARYLDDLAIVVMMLNPDGRPWIDRLAGGLADTGERAHAGGWRAKRKLLLAGAADILNVHGAVADVISLRAVTVRARLAAIKEWQDRRTIRRRRMLPAECQR